MFANQIERTMEVYIDDILVKSKIAYDHVTNMKQSFETLQRYKMKLNLMKCAFKVAFGKFLSIVVN